MRRLARCESSIFLYIPLQPAEDRYSAAHSSSHLSLCVYAQRSTGKNILADTLEIPFDSFNSSAQSSLSFPSYILFKWLNTCLVESEIPFVRRNPDAARQLTIYLKISVSPGSATNNASGSVKQRAVNSPDNTRQR